jgi:dTDP-4-amino-4,6-dideoxygalactose transaminase
MPYYKKLGFREGDFPIAETVCNEVLSLPVHEFITQDQMEFTVQKIKEFYS